MDLTLAFKDIQGGLAGWRIWWRLAMLVSREQHKRSVLGPLWNTVGTIVMVLLFGVLYATLLGYETRTHLPYVSCGLVVWILYSEIIIRSCTVFTVSAAFVQQLSLPKSTYVFRVVASELINFFYSFLIILLPIQIWSGIYFAGIPLAIVGLILILVNAVGLGFILSVISLRFRDVAPMVSHLMRPLLFLTPIIWTSDKFPDRAFFIDANPFYHVVEIFRQPMLGESAQFESYLAVIFITLVIWILAILLLARYRARIPYWV